MSKQLILPLRHCFYLRYSAAVSQRKTRLERAYDLLGIGGNHQFLVGRNNCYGNL